MSDLVVKPYLLSLGIIILELYPSVDEYKRDPIFKLGCWKFGLEFRGDVENTKEVLRSPNGISGPKLDPEIYGQLIYES